MAKRIGSVDFLFISDIDNTLTGDEDALKKLGTYLEENHSSVGFGIATGRHLESAKEILDKYNLKPDILITSVGSEIYYGKNLLPDKGWSAFIRRRWYPDRIKEALKDFKGLSLQTDDGSQRAFKVSYDIKGVKDFDNLVAQVTKALEKTKSAYNLVVSHENFLDILPYRASKGSAVKYIAWKWNIEGSRVITAGDSGNDIDMLKRPFKGIVVANHEKSLDKLKDAKNIYFTERSNAHGVIEGLKKLKVIP